ncbi:MAG: hypothetical protein B6I22_13945 [Desulfobacteraceae bacterium 4572_123]|nr:MAG: hypothetical protein B6I22_13945 [Desulfobacteraceae bacterium 4572_123]
MRTGREKPTELNLSAILEGLLDADIEFILVGGLAAVMQGAPVTTMDVDIVHKRSAENISRLMEETLKQVNAENSMDLESKRSGASSLGPRGISVPCFVPAV